MVKVVVAKLKKYLIGVNLNHVESFRNINGSFLIILKNRDELMVDEILDPDFRFNRWWKMNKALLNLTGADFLEGFFLFRGKISLLLSVEKFIERLEKNDK